MTTASTSRKVSFWVTIAVPAVLALIPIIIAVAGFWSNYNHGAKWTPVTAKAVWTGELCVVEKKQGKNWSTFSDAYYDCPEAEEFVKQNSSFTQQLRTRKDDYVRFTYDAGGATQDNQTRLYGVSRTPLTIGQEFPIMVDPANPLSVDRPFAFAAEFKTMMIWIAVGLVLAVLLHFFLKWVMRANEKKLAQQQALAAASAAEPGVNPAPVAAAPPSSGRTALKWIGIGIFAVAGLAGVFLALGGFMNGDWGVVTFSAALIGFGAGIYRFLSRMAK